MLAIRGQRPGTKGRVVFSLVLLMAAYVSCVYHDAFVTHGREAQSTEITQPQGCVPSRSALALATRRLRMKSATDRIEKKILLRAPRERVWRAISDSKQFGSWFGVELDRPFVPGARMIGRIVPTTVDAEVARSQKPYEGMKFEFSVDRVEPMKLFSFRWHPFAVEPGVDYSKEPST